VECKEGVLVWLFDICGDADLRCSGDVEALIVCVDFCEYVSFMGCASSGDSPLGEFIGAGLSSRAFYSKTNENLLVYVGV
jgi:hypothetical protein